MLHITPWERAALVLLAANSASADIARRLLVPEHEMEQRLAELFTRMGASSRADAVAAATRRGLLVAGR